MVAMAAGAHHERLPLARLWSIEDAERSLPLVARIVCDIHSEYAHLADLELDRRRLAKRRRRYNSQRIDGLLERTEYRARQAEVSVESYQAELMRLGVYMRDPVVGLVEWPTLDMCGIEGWLSWCPGEDHVCNWRPDFSRICDRRPLIAWQVVP